MPFEIYKDAKNYQTCYYHFQIIVVQSGNTIQEKNHENDIEYRTYMVTNFNAINIPFLIQFNQYQ